MAGKFEGKVCVITGTGGSIGHAAAVAFAREGAKVVGCDVNVERAERAVETVRAAGGTMTSLQPCDLTDPAACQRLVDLAVGQHGRIDVLYNNAAMAYWGWVDQLSIDDWRRTIDQELHLVFLLTRAAWPHLIRQGGAIVNMASVSAWQAYKGFPGLAHAAAKGAVLSMTRQLAMEGAAHGLRVNSLSPGLIRTHQTEPFLQNEEAARQMTGFAMMDRPGRPEEVARAAVFLASDDASFITATDLRVDGGTLGW